MEKETNSTECWDEYGFPVVYTPEKLRKMESKLEISRETFQALRDYFDAASEFYAIIPLGMVFKIYNSQNPAISQADFLAAADIIAHEQHNYSILRPQVFQEDSTSSDPMEQELVAEHIYAFDDEAYWETKNGQEGREWYIPAKEELLKYTDEYYIEETPQLREMAEYLRKTQRKLKCPIDDVIAEIEMCIRLEYPYQNVANDCQRLGVQCKTPQEVREFAEHLLEMSYHTRRYSLCGHTPAEAGLPHEDADEVASQLHFDPDYRDYLGEMAALFNAKTAPAATIAGTPARNAPCPCGSGRKYKNCCGKKK